MAPKIKTRADFPKGPKGTSAFRDYKLRKLARAKYSKKLPNSVLKIGQKKLLGKALTASAMAENVRLGVKQATIKNKKGDYQGFVGLAQKGVRSLKNAASKKDAEMRAKGFVKNKRGRYVKKKVNKVEKTVNKQKSNVKKVDPKQFDSRRPKTVKSTNVKSTNVKSTTETPKYKKVTQKELDAKIAERKKTKPADKLKVNYRRTKGEGIEGKSKGYRGDTRITKKLKKSGFTETRLAKLRKKNAEFQAAKKDKKKMKAYRAKYG